MDRKREIEKRVESNVEYYVKKIVKVIAMVILAGALFFLANYVLMRLWNWLMPDLFGLATITFWQALGILVMAKIIFGFGGGGGKSKGGSHQRRKHRSNHKCSSLRRDFDEWKHYDQFWKEEGEEAFKAYVAKIKNENHENN